MLPDLTSSPTTSTATGEGGGSVGTPRKRALGGMPLAVQMKELAPGDQAPVPELAQGAAPTVGSRPMDVVRDALDGDKYDGKIAAKTLDEDEQIWFDELLMKHPGLKMLFKAYGPLPEVTVFRVKKLSGGAAGRYVRGKRHIAIADKARTEGHKTLGLVEAKRIFQWTLLHELLHFLSREVKGKKHGLGELKSWFRKPQKKGKPPFCLGWIEYAGRVGRWEQKFVRARAKKLDPSAHTAALFNASKMEAPPTTHAYESVEEDMAESLSLFLLDHKSNSALKAKHKYRWQLCGQFMGQFPTVK